jgi:hypothetical protein
MRVKPVQNGPQDAEPIDRFSALVAVFLAVPIVFLAILVSGLVIWTAAVFFFQLFTKPNLLIGMLQLVICSLGAWFAHSLIVALIGRSRGWKVISGLVVGLAALSPIALDIIRSISGPGLHGGVASLGLGPAVCTVVLGGWISTALLLLKMVISWNSARIRTRASETI